MYHRGRMAQDLRGYLDLLKRKRPDELVIVSKPIDPTELFAVIDQVSKAA